MKCKNSIMFICLIMLALLSLACVSATDNIDDNANLTTDDSNVEEVISSDNTGDMEVQTNDSELENDDTLKADGNEAVGSQAVNDSDNDIISNQAENNDMLGASDEDDVLGVAYMSFSQINHEQNIVQFYNSRLDLTFTDSPLNAYSVGVPLNLKGGSGKMISFSYGNFRYPDYYNIYFRGQYEGNNPHGVFDARGISSIAKINGRQTLSYFQDIDFVNAVNGAFVIGDMVDSWFEKFNAICKVEFVNCNFKNITGGVVVANYKSNISFKNCVFEDIDSEFGVLKSNCSGVNVTFTDCIFKTVKSKATAEVSNSANGVATFTLKPVYTNYIGAVSYDGNVKFINCEFWNGTGYAKTNEANIRETTLRNKTGTIRIFLENPKTEANTYDINFTTDDNGQFKFNYKDDSYFMNVLGGDGYNNFTLTFNGDSYILPFNYTGSFETIGGFTYLQNLINSASDNSVINLNRNLRYSEVYDKDIVDGIAINKNNLTIDGKGHTIDARGFSRIFNIPESSFIREVTLKNMTLVNGYHELRGGAINLYGNYFTLENMEFRNNSAKGYGGAIAFYNNNAKLINCTFISNRAGNQGGAIFFGNEGGNYAIVQNNAFINNTAKNGGAIYSFLARNVNFMGNRFISNNATLGGAIYNYRSPYNVLNQSIFSANTAKMGGAIYYEVNTIPIVSSNFTRNVAEKGGAIYVSNKDNNGNPTTGKSLDISNSYFMDNKATDNEIIIINDDRDNQILTAALKGGENYINAIYAEDGADAYFNNTFYRADDEWLTADHIPKSEYAPFVKIIMVDLKNNAFSISDITDINGYAYLNYGNEPAGYYPFVDIQHKEDSCYPYTHKLTSVSVKPLTFTDLQRIINNTPEGGELRLSTDFVYSEGDEAITDGVLINKSITIMGQGHIIDAKGKTRIFNVTASNVAITGLELLNGKDVAGSVAFFNGENITINNCILSNNPGQVVAKSGGRNFDLNDNWFGNDWTNYNETPIGDFEVDRWYFLNITIVPNNVVISLNNKYFKSSDAAVVDDDSNLPFVDFTFTTTRNMKLNATENISVWRDIAVSYFAGDFGYDYDNPLGITLYYGDKSFTKSQRFSPEMHLEGLPDEIEYWNVSDYRVRVTGTFGEVIRSTLEDRIIFELGDGRTYPFTESMGDWNNLPIKTVLGVNEIGNYNYTLSILNYYGSPAFYPALKGNFSVVGITTTLNIVPIEDYTVGENKTLIVVLEQPYGNVPEGVLTISINGILQSRIVLDGSSRVFTLDLDNFSPYTYRVMANYEPNSLYYTRSSETMIFKVNRHDSVIDLDIPKSITYGEDLPVKVNITHKVEATYRIVDENNVTVEEANIPGNELLINGLPCGKYTLTVHNSGNKTVSESTVTREFTVNKITPKIEVNCAVAGPFANITVKMDSNVTGSILFDNEPVAIVNGFASYLKEYKTGFHVVNVTYQTDKPESYNNVSKSASFYIAYTDPALKNTTIEVVPEIAYNNVFLTAKVNENATGIVMFTVDGESVAMAIINGEALYHNVLDAGTYTVLVTYIGDSKFNGNSTTTTIVVSDPVKENTTIASKVNIDENIVEITVEVNEYATGEVAFTINGNTCKVDVFFGKAVYKGYFDYGYHEVDIKYLGDDSFEANSTSVSFTVEKPALKNTTVDVTARINERDVELFINLDAETNGFALIDIDGSETYVKVDYGFAYYKTVLNPGNYTINVKYMGDNQFNPAETNKTLTINQPVLKDSNITAHVYVNGNNLLVHIIVPSDATGIVMLDINGTGTYYNLTGSNDEGISYSAILPIGTYNLTAAYSGDDYYNYSAVNELFEIVRSLNTNITAKSTVNETTVTITVEVDSRATGFVEIAVAGKKFYVPVVDGVAKFENRYAVGNYVANVTYLGDDTFNSNTTSVDFIIIEQKESLKNTTLDVAVSVDGNDVVVTVNVDEMATGLVAFELDDDVIYLPVNNGQVISEYVLPKGHYDLIVTYIGSEEFNSNQTTVGIDISEDILKNTTINSVSIVEFNGVTIIVDVNKNATGYVEFEILGKKFYEPVVDGVAVFKNTYPAGSYGVNIKYLGDAKFNSAKTTDTFIVIEQEPTLKNTTLDVNITINGNHVNITAYVNKSVSGLIAFNVDLEEFIYVPINNGVASQEYLLPIGHHSVDIIYVGNDEYNAIQTTRVFDVIENSTDIPSLKTVIFAPEVSTTYDGNGYLTITIKDENDKFVASRNVVVTINGKTEIVKTNNEGVAKLSTNGLAPKTYIVNIAFEGDGTYAKSSTTSKVVVGKAASTITAKNKAFKKSKKIKKYAITLKSGKKPVKNVKVTLKVKGKTYNAKTNAKGKAVFKIKKLSKKGKFKATIKFKGNAYYKAVSKKVKITIK